MRKVDFSRFELSALIAGASCALVILVGFLVLLVRLKNVQISDTAHYLYTNARQSERRILTSGPRGRILDRNGVVLAGNRMSTAIVCQPKAFQQKDEKKTVAAISNGIERVSAAIGRPSIQTERSITRHVRQSVAMPLEIWRGLTDDELAYFAEHEEEFPGFEIQDILVRTYPKGKEAAHLLGYVGRGRGEAVEGDERYHFFEPEMRGRAGLETYYDSFLLGVPGEKRIVVDASGFAIDERTEVEAGPGPDLVLTLDSRIQSAVEAELEGLKGACVVLDPRNGDVLAMASAPGFDPNEFVPVLPTELYESYAKDPDKPLLNRACGGSYAPGSTFKPITALAALTAGIPASHTHDCNGVFTLRQMKLHCSARWGHGTLDMRHALMKSCNPYFCDLALDAGTNRLMHAARAFGLGSKTGIDFGEDVAGAVPDAEWKMRTYQEKWYLADVAHMAIGQGMLLVSPLQMARVAGAIGTGSLVTPHLKKGLPVVRKSLPFAAPHLRVVREGMWMVVNGDGRQSGTGSRVAEAMKDTGVEVCGKTGTAEIGQGETRRKNTWFIAYAPAKNPTVAIAMVIENGESGGGTTAPKVGNILRKIFE